MTSFDMPSTGTWEVRGGWVIRRLAQDAGLTQEQAAGLVGNLGYESRGFATLQEMKPAVEGSDGGFGWAQWTGPRRRTFEKWCAENAVFPNSDEANYGYLLHELLGDYKSFAAHLRQMHSIEDACRLTHEQYERPQDVLDGSYRSGPDRLKWARRAMTGAKATPIAVADPAGETAEPMRAHEAVKAVQRALADSGVYPADLIDGLFGRRSLAALNALLMADGQMTPETLLRRG